MEVLAAEPTYRDSPSSDFLEDTKCQDPDTRRSKGCDAEADIESHEGRVPTIGAVTKTPIKMRGDDDEDIQMISEDRAFQSLNQIEEVSEEGQDMTFTSI